MIFLLASLAFAHGGEDHGAAPPSTAMAEGTRVPTWSREFDAVLRLDDLHADEPGHGAFLIADWRTSAPIATGSASIDLSTVQFTARSSADPGVWPFDATFPGSGPFDGTATVITDDRSDALGLPLFTLPAHEPTTLIDTRTVAWTVPLCLSLTGFALGVALGLVTSRIGLKSTASAGAAVGLVAGLLIDPPTHADQPPPLIPHTEGLRLPLESQFLLELRTDLAAVHPFVERVRALGTTVARPGGAAEIHAPVAGLFSFPPGITLLPGEPLTAGDPIATITETLSGADRSSYAEARAAAKVRLAEANKQLQLAERDQERAKSLGDVLSDRERFDREKAVEVAREEVRQAKVAAQALDETLPTTTLRAPLSGRISALLARPGDVVAPAEVILRITDDGGLWVDASVPEIWAGRLSIGSQAVLTSDAHRDTPIAATVLDPGLEADPASGTLRVVLAVAEPVEWLVPGMSVTAEIATGETRAALVVPDSAVVDGIGETLVFVKLAPERFEARRVRLGGLSGGQREILQGLEPDERVVVDGTYALRSLLGR